MSALYLHPETSPEGTCRLLVAPSAGCAASPNDPDGRWDLGPSFSDPGPRSFLFTSTPHLIQIHIRPLRPLPLPIPFQCHLPDQPPVHSNSHHNHRISCSSLRQQTQFLPTTTSTQTQTDKHQIICILDFFLIVASQPLHLSSTRSSPPHLARALTKHRQKIARHTFAPSRVAYPSRNRTTRQPPLRPSPFAPNKQQ